MHPLLLDWLTYGVGVVMPVGWSRQWVVGWMGSPDGDELAAIVGELEPVGVVGVSADEELAAVVGVVMTRA